MPPKTPRPTHDHVLLARDVDGLLILLDHLAVAGPEVIQKQVKEVCRRLKARAAEVLHPGGRRKAGDQPGFIDNGPETTSTAD